MNRKPIFILSVPTEGYRTDDKERIYEGLKALKADYHVIVIENNPCEQGRSANRITYDLLNGSFWNYLYLWFNRKKLL